MSVEYFIYLGLPVADAVFINYFASGLSKEEILKITKMRSDSYRSRISGICRNLKIENSKAAIERLLKTDPVAALSPDGVLDVLYLLVKTCNDPLEAGRIQKKIKRIYRYRSQKNNVYTKGETVLWTPGFIHAGVYGNKIFYAKYRSGNSHPRGRSSIFVPELNTSVVVNNSRICKEYL